MGNQIPEGKEYYAQTRPGDPNPEHWQRLEDHLFQTAKKAGEFAAAFGAKDWDYLAGLWHDLINSMYAREVCLKLFLYTYPQRSSLKARNEKW